jgi:hypothetical protein
MNNKTVIYSLTIEDLQTVALQEINRTLSQREIENIKEKIAAKIDWYDAICHSLSELTNN